MQIKQTALLLAVIAVIVAVISAKAIKSSRASRSAAPTDIAGTVVPATPGTPEPTPTADEPGAAETLPRLLDLGSVGCIACKEMEPVLDELERELAGKVEVAFIDIAQDETAADKYKIQLIPTQIFFDAEGNELFRQTGAYPKKQILEKMAELGMIAD
ncbi:MAG: thioredoxin family protein [Phycisphaerae bacterium]|nr:thioredoxin family protein [Phycisphaerae bacterium]